MYISHVYQSCDFFGAGDVTIPHNTTFTLNTGLAEEVPQFILTCISVGGPATTVVWTRNGAVASGTSTTVLDDYETAQYTHNLTVTGRLGGIYECTVSNNKPSTSSQQLLVERNTHESIMYGTCMHI